MKYIGCFILGMIFQYAYGVYRGFKMLKSAKHDTELMRKLDELGK